MRRNAKRVTRSTRPGEQGYFKQRSCLSKRQYQSASQAWGVAHKINSNEGDKCHAYHCKFCGWWHVGSEFIGENDE